MKDETGGGSPPGCADQSDRERDNGCFLVVVRGRRCDKLSGGPIDGLSIHVRIGNKVLVSEDKPNKSDVDGAALLPKLSIDPTLNKGDLA